MVVAKEELTENMYSEKLAKWHFMKIRCIVSGLLGISSAFPIGIDHFNPKKRDVHLYPPQQEGIWRE